MTEMMIALLVLLCVIAILWYRATRFRPPVENPALNRALASFLDAVERTSLHLHQPEAISEADDAIEAVVSAATGMPVKDDIRALKRVWAELQTSVAGFKSQPSQSTLQSSILTTRIEKQKEQILELVTQIRQTTEGA